MLSKSVCFAFVLLIFSGCMQAGESGGAPKSQNDLTLGASKVRTSECRRYFSRYGYQPSRIEAEVSGWSPENPAIGYMRELDYHLTRALVGSGAASKVYELLSEASYAKSFTVPKSSYGGGGLAGPSPAYMSAAILSSVAYAYDYLRPIYGEAKLSHIKSWANILESHVDLPFEAGMLDSRGAIASSRVAWGAASNQRQIFDAGIRELRSVLSKAKRNNMFFESGDAKINDEIRKIVVASNQNQSREPSLDFIVARMNTEVFNHVVAAASIAKLNGVDAYTWKTRNGGTIHDLVDAQAVAVLAAGRSKISVAATALTVSGADQNLMIMIPKGFGVHQAWVPIYLSQFGARTDLDSVLSTKAVDLEMQKVDSRPYYGNNIGGPVACYWG